MANTNDTIILMSNKSSTVGMRQRRQSSVRKTRLSVDLNSLANVLIIHADLGENGIIRRPTVVSSMGIHLIVLKIDILLAERITEGDLGGLAHVARDDTPTDEIHQVGDGSDGYRSRVDLFVKASADVVVESLERFRSGSNAAESLREVVKRWWR